MFFSLVVERIGVLSAKTSSRKGCIADFRLRGAACFLTKEVSSLVVQRSGQLFGKRLFDKKAFLKFGDREELCAF